MKFLLAFTIFKVKSGHGRYYQYIGCLGLKQVLPEEKKEGSLLYTKNMDNSKYPRSERIFYKDFGCLLEE